MIPITILVDHDNLMIVKLNRIDRCTNTDDTKFKIDSSIRK